MGYHRRYRLDAERLQLALLGITPKAAETCQRLEEELLDVDLRFERPVGSPGAASGLRDRLAERRRLFPDLVRSRDRLRDCLVGLTASMESMQARLLARAVQADSGADEICRAIEDHLEALSHEVEAIAEALQGLPTGS